MLSENTWRHLWILLILSQNFKFNFHELQGFHRYFCLKWQVMSHIKIARPSLVMMRGEKALALYIKRIEIKENNSILIFLLNELLVKLQRIGSSKEGKIICHWKGSKVKVAKDQKWLEISFTNLFFIRSMGVIDVNSDSKYFLPTTGHVFERRCGQQLFVLTRLCFQSLIKRNTQNF